MDNKNPTKSGKRLPRFLNSDRLSVGQTISLSKSSTHHAKNVLRLKVGDQVTIFDGRGREFIGTITKITEKLAEVITHEEINVSHESPVKIMLAQGLSRSDRMDFTIQKAVELGVYQILPLFTARSQIKLRGDRLDRKLRHWGQLIDSSCEQCLRNVRPSLLKPIELKKWLNEIDNSTKKNWDRVILDPNGTKSIKSLGRAKNIILLIGPEAGFADQELLQAINANFTPIRLGTRILRTETAGLAGIAIIQAIWGDL